MILKRFANVYRSGGLKAVTEAFARRLRNPYARSLPRCRELLTGRIGLEIGGASSIFAKGGLVSVYPVAQRVDNVSFADRTLWSETTGTGQAFDFHPAKAPGRRIVTEGSDLRILPSETYDFVLSSHMLEHTANPLRALGEWRRVLKPQGALLLVLPHRDGTFDHRRPITTLQHLVADRDNDMNEDDLTHVQEVLDLHDLSRDPGVANAAEFRDRVRRNPEFRSVHHHVFDTRLAAAMVRYAGFRLIAVEALEPYHIIVLAKKDDAGPGEISGDDLVEEALKESPFETDRAAS